MDDASRINAYKQGLRLKYRAGTASPDIVGLRRFITQLFDGEASDSVAITSHNFADGGAAGELVLEPMAKLQAAVDVLAEIDPENTPRENPNYAYLRFGAGCTE